MFIFKELCSSCKVKVFNFIVTTQIVDMLSVPEAFARSDNPIDRAIFGGISWLIVAIILAILYVIKK